MTTTDPITVRMLRDVSTWPLVTRLPVKNRREKMPDKVFPKLGIIHAEGYGSGPIVVVNYPEHPAFTDTYPNAEAFMAAGWVVD